MTVTSVTPATGMVRIKIETLTGRHVLVGPFATLGGAKRMTEDLLAEQPPAVRSVRVEHRQRGHGWKPAWSWLASSCLGLLLVGCVTGGVNGVASTPIPREVGRVPTAEERAIVDTFLPQVVAAARLEGFSCNVVPVAMQQMDDDSMTTIARPSRNPCNFYLQVSTVYLRRDSALEHMGEAAHELGHVMDGDWTPARSKVPQIERERQADALAIRILNHMDPAVCQAAIALTKRIRAENLGKWGTEQRTTVGTHPSYTERIETLERDCRGSVQ